MGDTWEIALGVALSGFMFLFGGAALGSLSGYIETRGLQNRQTIRGIVVDENYATSIFGNEYQISIRTPKGRKVVVNYTSWVSGVHELAALNTLFTQGDIVKLDVGTNKAFDGTQRFVGLAGRLVEDKTE